MAKLLSRSKSFRQLRPLRKDSKGPAVPEHDVWETHFSDLDRAQGNTNQQAKTTVGNFTFAIESAGDIARPKTANEAVDRRELMAMGSPISVTSGKETFAFPTPVRRPFTPNSADIKSAGMESNPSDIGLAIGSPSHDTRFQLDNSWTLSPPQGLLIAPNRETLTPISTTARSQTSYSNRAIQGEWKEKNEVAKPKISRWRSLGGLFARRPPARASPEPQYQTISQQRLPNPFDLNTENYALPWQGEAAPNVVYSLPHNFGNPVRSDSPKKSSPRPRWGLLRSQTAPTTRRGETSPLPPSKGPVLDVDIPTTKMERYSVMFNGVITKKSSSSLLVRRQANADNKSQVPGESLKTLDLPLQPPKRRATTPEPSPSYRLLIFPPESSSNNASKPRIPTVHRPRPLRRSNTAPAALSPGLKDKAMSEALSQLSPMSERDELLEDCERQALTPTPSEPSTPNTPSDDHNEVSPFNPFSTDNVKNKTWSESFVDEPSWEMITIGKVAEPGDRASGQVQVEGAEESNWHNTSPVQVRVARSMSVTKARRTFVGPKVTGVKDGERLIQRKPLTPTLVQMVDVPGKNRKSIHATIVTSE